MATDSAIVKFQIMYTNSNGDLVNERPRLMISADGKYKSLWIGEQIILATTTVDSPDADLWDAAREASRYLSESD